MKRILAFALAFVMLLSLVACNVEEAKTTTGEKKVEKHEAITIV